MSTETSTKHIFICRTPDCTNELPWVQQHRKTDTGLCQTCLEALCAQHKVSFTDYNGKPIPQSAA